MHSHSKVNDSREPATSSAPHDVANRERVATPPPWAVALAVPVALLVSRRLTVAPALASALAAFVLATGLARMAL